MRIIQRFGRIDRIGSRAKEVQLLNFWPTAHLDRYIIPVMLTTPPAVADAFAMLIAVLDAEISELQMAGRNALQERSPGWRCLADRGRGENVAKQWPSRNPVQ